MNPTLNYWQKNGFFTYAKYLDRLQRATAAPDEEFDTTESVTHLPEMLNWPTAEKVWIVFVDEIQHDQAMKKSRKAVSVSSLQFNP